MGLMRRVRSMGLVVGDDDAASALPHHEAHQFVANRQFDAVCAVALVWHALSRLGGLRSLSGCESRRKRRQSSRQAYNLAIALFHFSLPYHWRGKPNFNPESIAAPCIRSWAAT